MLCKHNVDLPFGIFYWIPNLRVSYFCRGGKKIRTGVRETFKIFTLFNQSYFELGSGSISPTMFIFGDAVRFSTP